MTRTLVLLSLALPAAALTACPSSQTSECGAICDALSACGMLPSSLGARTGDPPTTLANCKARCAASEPPDVEAVKKCTGAATDASEVGCPEACSTLVNCLVSLFPGDGVAGRAQLRVVPVQFARSQAGGAEVCAPALCVDGGDCGGSTELAAGEFTGKEAEDWCKASQSGQGRATVEQNGAYTFGPSSSCTALLSTGTSFDGLLPGRVRVWLELEASPLDAGADAAHLASPLCTVFYGQVIRLHAGESRTSRVPLPAVVPPVAFRCEVGAACHDGTDNDGNTFIDCSDPRCTSECSDAGQRGDGAIADADARHGEGSLDAALD